MMGNVGPIDWNCRRHQCHSHNYRWVVLMFVQDKQEVDMWLQRAYNIDDWLYCNLDRIDVWVVMLLLRRDGDDADVDVHEDVMALYTPGMRDNIVLLSRPQAVYDDDHV